MSVICAACLTENRANAMFCLGCAGKLPAFAATGPSALEAMKTVPSALPSDRRASRRAPGESSVLLPTESPGLMLRVGLLALAIGLAFVVWYAYVTRKVPMSVADKARVVDAMPAGPAAAANPPATSPAPLAPLQPVPLQPVPLASSLSIGETAVAPGASASPALPAPQTAQLAPVERTLPPPRATEPSRGASVDPRRGCENLNFVFAARCEATNCGKPEYTRHPRCDTVREQRQRDEARRNPTLGY